PLAAPAVAGGPRHPVRGGVHPGEGHRRSPPPHPPHVGHARGLRGSPALSRPRPPLRRAVPVLRGASCHRRSWYVAPRSAARERADPPALAQLPELAHLPHAPVAPPRLPPPPPRRP